MFTGIVETMGTVVRMTPGRGSSRLVVASTLPVAARRLGASVAVDGACLTVSRSAGTRFEADVVEETLSRTTLRALRPGTRVNLETPLRLGDPVGGHLVQGHVDAVARVIEVVREGNDRRLRVDLSPETKRYVSLKGSIALHGVSLTVSRVGAGWLEVALIPETRLRTTLGSARPGTLLNVEVDLLARYLETLTSGRAGSARKSGSPPRPGRRAGGKDPG